MKKLVINLATQDNDYFNEYMQTAQGLPIPIVRGVLIFFKSTFSNEELETLEREISQLEDATLENTQKILKTYNVGEEITRQILVLLNKKFKEAIEKKAITSQKLDFIRSVKKKH